MMKETPDDIETRDRVHRVAREQLQSIVDRIERTQQDIDEHKAAQKEIYAESKDLGYDVKVLRKLIAQRKRDKEDVQEEAEIMDLYAKALEGEA